MHIRPAITIVLGAALLLIIPLIATYTVEGFNWQPFDFAIVWVLLSGAGLAYTFIVSRSANLAYRVAAGLAVLAALALIWINGAVGIIGNEDNPANLLYGAVLATGLVGAFLARLKPRGMSYALMATAIVQAFVPVAAFIIWRPDMSPGVVQVFMLNALFVLVFAVSGLLFRRAAHA